MLSIAVSIDTAHTWAGSPQRQQQSECLKVLNDRIAPGDFVVAPPPVDPVYRRDTFFVWFNSTDPAQYDTEAVLQQMPATSDLVEVSAL